MPFELHHYGINVMKNESFLEDFENTLRVYAEECDFMQGFHLFVDAYGGLTGSMLELIDQEYSKKSILNIFSFPYLDNKVSHRVYYCLLLYISFKLLGI